MSLLNVIIPVYNAKMYLRKAVESIINQPFKDIKVILIDDGSTDGSSQLYDELADGQPRCLVIHQKMAVYP